MSTPRLAAVRVASADVDAAASFFATVCGSVTEPGGKERLIRIGDASIIVEPAADGASGITAVEVDGSPNAAPQSKLNGVEVRTDANRQIDQIGPAEVALDHVAIMVNDLETAAAAWETATGVTAELIGVHPISNGTLRAARLAVGDRMVELISPVAGEQSAVSSRLERFGEGAMALALPAVDLDVTRQRLEAQGIRLIWQQPHWLVHPANPAGVLIQLTPRVRH